jgi:hypothetical protein
MPCYKQKFLELSKDIQRDVMCNHTAPCYKQKRLLQPLFPSFLYLLHVLPAMLTGTGPTPLQMASGYF